MTEEKPFSGEDENAGFATPLQDMVASAMLVLLSVWVMVESILMKNPGSTSTSPGLLPFLTAAGLCAMAIALGYMALQRHNQHIPPLVRTERSDTLRALALFAFIAFYLLCLQFVSFEYRFEIAGLQLGYGSFEVVTIIALTVILAVFWGRSLSICFLVAAGWITLLAGAFRYVFVIPLPGSI